MKNGRKIKVGAAQTVTVSGISPNETDRKEIVRSIDKNVAHLCQFIERAAEDGVDILCFPEDVCGMASIACHGTDEGLFRSIINEKAGDVLSAFCSKAKTCGIYVVATSALPDQGGIFNSACLIGPDGKEIGRYHKTHLAPKEDRFIASGMDYPVFETNIGRVGMLICWDLMFPETARILALNGAELILVPTLGFDFGGECIGEARMRMRAFDNALHIVTAMRASPKGIGPGRSCIVDPRGHILGDAGYTPDTIITAYIDPENRSSDCCDPERESGLNMWQRWTKSRHPHTYKAIVRVDKA